MKCRRIAGCLLGLVAGCMILEAGLPQVWALPQLFGSKKNEPGEQQQAAALVPMDLIPTAHRGKVSQVLARPTIYTRGPLETFECRPELYRWFLDNPDRTAVAWRRLGAKCLDIERRGKNLFGWTDAQGSDVTWTALHSGPNVRVWFAEGQVKPGTLFPMVPVQCVVVLRHSILKQEKDGALMQHQADVFAFTDSKTATVVTRMLGPSVPKMARQGAGQLQMFFGAMAWYCHENPDRVEVLLRPDKKPAHPDRPAASFNPTGMIYPAGFSGNAPVPYE
jgi:hypothetical protein